ncbi:hypothetical protein ACQEU3_46860 [Spirillospora sp. CA-253888]
MAKINDDARNAAANAIAALIDGGSSAGMLRIYTGTAPATPGTAPTGTKLVEITLNDPAFATASSGSAALDVTPALTGTGLANGTAGYARLVDSTQAAGSGLGVIDLTVSATGGGGEVQLATLSISTGLTVDLTSGTLTMPAS